MCSLKEAGKVDEALREFLWLSRGGRAAQEVLVQEKRREEAGVSSQGAVVQAEYHLEFGQHKEKTISHVLDSRKQSERDYFGWIFASSKAEGLTPHAQRLRSALEVAGRWEEVLQRARFLAVSWRKPREITRKTRQNHAKGTK